MKTTRIIIEAVDNGYIVRVYDENDDYQERRVCIADTIGKVCRFVAENLGGDDLSDHAAL